MLLLAINKPYNVVCQFRPHADDETLADYVKQPGIYPAGRLDKDSEGLLLLTDDGPLQHLITQPRHKQAKGYWVQVEGDPSDSALDELRSGVELNDGPTRPALIKRMVAPNIWVRTPPIRERQSIPTSWLDITIFEGRNRQVRRMTAAVGYPTLRLVRYRIGPWYLDDLQPGEVAARNVPADILRRLQKQPTGKTPPRKRRHSS